MPLVVLFPDLRGALYINMLCPTSLMKVGFPALWVCIHCTEFHYKGQNLC